MTVLLLIVGAYLLGSIPTAVLAGRIFHGVDVRDHGSGNAGATNTIRVLGTPTGIIVLLIDMVKGWFAVALVSFWPVVLPPGVNINLIELFLALAAVTGHIFPVFAGFRGGKGVATFLGTALGIFPLTFLCAIAIFLLVFIPTRYVSLGSIVSAITMPVIAAFVFVEPWPSVTFAIIVAVVIPLTHHKNIKRLLKGEEKRLVFSSKGSTD